MFSCALRNPSLPPFSKVRNSPLWQRGVRGDFLFVRRFKFLMKRVCQKGDWRHSIEKLGVVNDFKDQTFVFLQPLQAFQVWSPIIFTTERCWACPTECIWTGSLSAWATAWEETSFHVLGIYWFDRRAIRKDFGWNSESKPCYIPGRASSPSVCGRQGSRYRWHSRLHD